MSPNHILACSAVFAALSISPAVADNGRFSLEKVEGGYVRLNTVTGEVSFCQEKDGQFVCRISPSERMAYENEIAELHERLDQIEERMALLEGKSFEKRNALPSDEEFEKTMGYMEKFFRRFMGIVKDLDEEFGEGSSKEVDPDRT